MSRDGDSDVNSGMCPKCQNAWADTVVLVRESETGRMARSESCYPCAERMLCYHDYGEVARPRSSGRDNGEADVGIFGSREAEYRETRASFEKSIEKISRRRLVWIMRKMFPRRRPKVSKESLSPGDLEKLREMTDVGEAMARSVGGRLYSAVFRDEGFAQYSGLLQLLFDSSTEVGEKLLRAVPRRVRSGLERSLNASIQVLANKAEATEMRRSTLEDLGDTGP